MNAETLSDLLIKQFGKDIFQNADDFPYNKISIISSRENPFKLCALILDNEREFHLIINQKKKRNLSRLSYFSNT